MTQPDLVEGTHRPAPVMVNRSRAQPWHAAMTDMGESLRQWRIWHLLAWLDVKQRYRRSTLGPLWLTVSLVIQLLTMGVIVSTIFAHSGERFFPYLAAGLIVWNLISGLVSEGAMSLINASAQILNTTRPLFTHYLKTAWKSVIISAHHMIVMLGIYVIFGLFPLPEAALLLVSYPLAVLAVAWLPFVFAILSTRFRDVPVIVQSAIGVLFWLTPILYYPDQLGEWRIVVDLNPLTYVMGLIRQPLLGEAPALLDWAVSLAIAAVGWALAALVFARFRHRVAYWL